MISAKYNVNNANQSEPVIVDTIKENGNGRSMKNLRISQPVFNYT